MQWLLHCLVLPRPEGVQALWFEARVVDLGYWHPESDGVTEQVLTVDGDVVFRFGGRVPIGV